MEKLRLIPVFVEEFGGEKYVMDAGNHGTGKNGGVNSREIPAERRNAGSDQD